MKRHTPNAANSRWIGHTEGALEVPWVAPDQVDSSVLGSKVFSISFSLSIMEGAFEAPSMAPEQVDNLVDISVLRSRFFASFLL